ncbi:MULTISPECIES: superoxide dismutase family protein [Bacillus]|jgi:Cu/Zn superoxide dismutase|uniref:Superoxide dismutase family protein n=2 Tax=Bacillus subtilis TaxID=1423 RepID=A0AC61ZYL8_BACIU|nr:MULTISPECIES: superoxide dismutase family protein [Bacillus]AOL29887.1 superoxide dismutase [Alkalicoccobacillus gibsonii]MDP4102540.1 superoxide dismutase family protein [Bacillota bacterium]WJD90601.1 superoxide dismutase family protein [Bacillus spizizenii]ADV92843.1 superoxide dismutase (exported lipoprotein) [Bacillus subtilis BSn5]AGA23429.1 Superoxide dismutase-like protein YojM [Bacillus subtilis subsp. subtilis str. BSP1]
MYRLLLLMMLTALGVAGCGQKKPPDPPNRVPEKKVVETSAFGHHVQLVNREGKAVGFIEIKESDDEGLDIHISANSLRPGASLGFHIYEKGSCVRPDFESAGGPFNPLNKEHGFNNPMGHHAGDLPNLEVGADGKVDVIMNAPDTSLKKGSKLNILDEDGSAFIIHEQADDYLTNPSGNSGARIVCGALLGNNEKQ